MAVCLTKSCCLFELLAAHALPPKFRLSNGNRNLTIVNVCKNCGAEKSDLQVIQCNASNTHGYAFAAGYVNVLCEHHPSTHICAVKNQ